MDGFSVSNGFSYAKNYYYLEWRNYRGADSSLRHARGIEYNTGLVIWYGDESFTGNWTGQHPGQGFLGVVDSHPKAIVGELDGEPSILNSTLYQVADAAFSYSRTPSWYIDDSARGIYDYESRRGQILFDDYRCYIDELIPDAGRILPQLGLKVWLVGQSRDNSAGAIWIFR